MWYRIRKEWNNGKWDKSQIGAYKSESEAISQCTKKLINDGYKVFDPEGKIIYPINYNKLALQIVKDGVTTNDNLKYWSDVFDNKEQLNLENVKTIISRYSDLLSKIEQPNKIETIDWNKIKILKIPVDKFKIKYIDSSIINCKNIPKTCFNLGYFANYKTNSGKFFTLPVANLVADINFSDFDSDIKYYLRRGDIRNGKIYWSCNANAETQFHDKTVSTLIIDSDNTVKIKKINNVNFDTIKYAVSGAPIISDSTADKSYRSEGWDTSISRSTGHGFLGIKDNKYIYYFYLTTFKNNLFDSEEVYKIIKDFRFTNLIKVDGGGSLYYQLNSQKITGFTTRQINNISNIE